MTIGNPSAAANVPSPLSPDKTAQNRNRSLFQAFCCSHYVDKLLCFARRKEREAGQLTMVDNLLALSNFANCQTLNILLRINQLDGS